jgi:hypothetical protein
VTAFAGPQFREQGVGLKENFFLALTVNLQEYIDPIA